MLDPCAGNINLASGSINDMENPTIQAIQPICFIKSADLK
jgi:hypothetical protein